MIAARAALCSGLPGSHQSAALRMLVPGPTLRETRLAEVVDHPVPGVAVWLENEAFG